MFVKPRTVFVRLKGRCDPGLNRVQAQEMRGKTMQRSNLRLLDVTKRGIGPGHDLIGRPSIPHAQVGDRNGATAARRIVAAFHIHQRAKPLPQTEFHLGGGFVGEGQGHDARQIQRIGPAHEQVQQPVHQQRGFPGSRPGDHDDIPVERGGGCFPGRLIRNLRRLSHATPSAIAHPVTSWPARTDRPATSSVDGRGGRRWRSHNECSGRPGR